MNDKGFTLIEQLVVLIILGIASAIAIPNLLGQKYQSDLRKDYNKIYFGVQEALQNADRQSSGVTITIPQTGSMTATLNNGSNALIEAINYDENTLIDTGLTLNYNFAGEKSTSTEETLIIGSTKAVGKYCIVFSQYLMAKGTYDETTSTCINNENLRYDNSI